MLGGTARVRRRGDPVPAVTRKAVHFNGECGCVVCNVQISLRLAAFANDSKHCAMQRRARIRDRWSARQDAIVLASGSVRRGVHVRFGRERTSGANASPRVDIRSPKRLATLCISTVSGSTRSADEPLPARIAGRSHLPRRASAIALVDAHACGYPASRTTRRAVVFNGEGARGDGR